MANTKKVAKKLKTIGDKAMQVKTPAVPLQEKARALQAELNTLLISRQREIFGLLVALFAGQHVLLLGPPGTAKSLLSQLLCKAIVGTGYFSWLMSKFTLPEEILGNFSLSKLKQDKFERVTSGMMPEAEIVFLDEIFKSNSAVLNALLTILNERIFYNGGKPQQAATVMVVGASNELPEDKSLDALRDRFKLAYWIDYLKDRQDRKKLLQLKRQQRAGKVAKEVQNKLLLAEVFQIQQEVLAVDVPDAIDEILLDLQEVLERDGGFIISDRVLAELTPLIQAAAYLNGRTVVTERDLLILKDCLWRDPKDQPELSRLISKATNPSLYKAEALVDACREAFASLPIDADIPEDQSSLVLDSVATANGQFADCLKKLEAMGGNGLDLTEYQEEVGNFYDRATELAARLSGIDLSRLRR